MTSTECKASSCRAWFAKRPFRISAAHGNRVHPPYRAFIRTLVWTGLRPSEAAGLPGQDIDLDRARLHVRRSRHL